MEEYGYFGVESQFGLNSLLTVNKVISFFKSELYSFVTITDFNCLKSVGKLLLQKDNNLKYLISVKTTVKVLGITINVFVVALNEEGYKILLKFNMTNKLDKLLESEIDLSNLAFITTGQDELTYKIIEKEPVLDIINIFKSKVPNLYFGLNLQKAENKYKMSNLVYTANLFNILLLPTYVSLMQDVDKMPYYKLAFPKNNLEYNVSLMTKEKLLIHFSDYKVVFKNLGVFLSTVTSYSVGEGYKFPIFTSKYTADEALDILCKKNIVKLGLDDEKHIQRMNYEMKVIQDMNYSGYFMIVADIVRFAKKSNIMVGPGRGSAVGSLVAHLLEIHEVDPIKYDLIFERFLNVSRSNFPDIDLDFPDDQRDLILNYVFEKYGADKCCYISTIVNKKIEIGLKEEISFVGSGIHPSGVIISPVPITDYVPCKLSESQRLICDLEHGELEELGFIKFDFLSLGTLRVIRGILNLNGLLWNDLDINDPDIYTYLSKGNVKNIFQIDTRLGSMIVRKIKPKDFIELANVLALMRPGAVNQIDSYQSSSANYQVEALNNLFKDTHGIILYQEQVINVIQIITKCDLKRADNIRREISKKNYDELKAEKDWFVESGVKNGFDKIFLEKLFSHVSSFGAYGFNKSHAIGYATIVAKMLYLKVHHFIDFTVGTMNSEFGNITEVNNLIYDLEHSNIFIQKPDINYSLPEFGIVNGKIYYPLKYINGIDSVTANKIIDLKQKGLFLSFDDFITRTDKILSVMQLTSLINSGALDIFKKTKAEMLEKIGTERFFQEGLQIHRSFKELDDNVLLKNLQLSIRLFVYDNPLSLAKTNPEDRCISFYQLMNISFSGPLYGVISRVSQLTSGDQILYFTNYRDTISIYVSSKKFGRQFLDYPVGFKLIIGVLRKDDKYNLSNIVKRIGI